MTATCFICGRPARFFAGSEPVCSYHRLGGRTWLGEPQDVVHERRLTWFHGASRAAAILAGLDAASEADLAAWRRVGA